MKRVSKGRGGGYNCLVICGVGTDIFTFRKTTDENASFAFQQRKMPPR